MIFRTKIILCCLGIIVLMPLSDAGAATRGLFLFDGLSQRVAFDYRYRALTLSEDGSGTTRSVRQRFEETYSVGINYVLRGPDLLLGGASIEAGWDQLESSLSGAASDRNSSTGGSRLLYDVYGTFLRYRPLSLRFFSNSRMSHVGREFSPGYDQTVHADGLSLHVKNLRIPFNVDYRRTTAQTEGLTADYTRKNRSLQIDAKHDVAGFSQTFLDLRFDEYRTLYRSQLDDYQLQSSRFLLTNDLTWASGKNPRRLSSRVNYTEQVGMPDARGYDWSENLDWHFGRALTGMLYYNRVYANRERSDLLRNQGRAALGHQFLACIDSRIGIELRDSAQNDGTETDRSGDVSLAYRKKLPRDSHLQVNLYQRYGRAERDFSTTLQTVLDEAHSAAALVPATLDRLHVVSETIVVRHADPAARLNPYVRDVDYRVDQAGATTLIAVLPGSDILDGDTLLIDYSHRDSAREAYDYGNRRAGVTLNFLKRYRVYGRWEETLRHYRSAGDPFSNAGGDLTEAVLGVDGSRQAASFGLEYKTRRTYYEARRSFEAFYQWSQRLKKGLLASGVGNYYARIEPAAGAREYRVNTVSIHGKYQTPVYRRGSLGLFTRYAHTSSDGTDRDDLSLGFDYRHGYGKFIMSVDAKTDWRFSGGQDRREETVNLKLSRYL